MEIKFKNQIQYLIDSNYYLLRHSKSFKLRKAFVTCVPFIMILLTNSLWRNSKPETIIFILTAGALTAFFAAKLFSWLPSRSMRSLLKEHSESDEYINSYTTISLTPKELIVKKEYMEVKFSWNYLSKVVIEDDYIYIHNKSINLIQIPFEAFKSLEEKEDFLNYINSKTIN